MSYITTPKEISLDQVLAKGFSLSPSQYKSVSIPNKQIKLVRDFLSRPLSNKDLGSEVGSVNYISKSTHFFIRTKALQNHSYLPAINEETAVPIMPNSFVNCQLKKGDLIISKDSNIGEVVVLDQDYSNYMLSGALYKLPVNNNKFYLLAFLKHSFFRQQLDFMVPKSSIIRHSKTMFLDCQIPMPNQNNEGVIEYVETLMKALINKEIAIRLKHKNIIQTITSELKNNQKSDNFTYTYPTLNDLKANGRIDAGFYSKRHKELIFPTLNYKAGYSTLDKQGLKLIPGPSLELKLLGTRIDSNIEYAGFYRLITPKQITNLGTVSYFEYLGTARKIKPIQFGDILFGESGTGRSMVYFDTHANTINNAHAHILRPAACTIEKAVTIRCILQYYKELGIIDYLTVGGSGGHLSPSYFDRVFIPNFPEDVQVQISALYHNPNIKYKSLTASKDTYMEFDDNFNIEAGISELDFATQKLQTEINRVIDLIIENKEINGMYSFLYN